MLATIVDRDVVEIKGSDASTYLQGQISQDVDRITAGSTAWSLVLAPTGRLTAWFRVHRVSDERFLVDLETGWAAPLVERLERFKLRTAVEFRILEGWRMLSIRNDPNAQDAEAPLLAVPGFKVQEVLSTAFEWPGFSGSDHLGEALVAPSGIELDDAAFERARILAGMPRLGVDINEGTIPAEGGERLIETSVSFTKGCYTGQELVARIDSRGGNVPRPLRVLVADGPLGVGGVVALEGVDVGVVTSVATSQGSSVAIAPLMRKVTPGSVVSVDGVAAVVQVPG